MFELPYYSWYKAILSSIVLSQQWSEVYIISSYSSEAVMKLTITEKSHQSRISRTPYLPIGGPTLPQWAQNSSPVAT